jgi:predicted nucleic acid-binding protein
VIALDTNVVVRLLVDDHPEQTRRARRLIEASPVVILPTVLLESEWVLRGAYRLTAGVIAQSFRKLLGVPGVTAESAAPVARAIDWYERGLDFADALHLALAHDAEALATFDAKLARRAARLSPARVMAL